MFEFCKKVEVYNIHNHHHYYSHNRTSTEINHHPSSTKILRMSQLKNSGQHQKGMRKGLKLSKEFDCFENQSRGLGTINNTERTCRGIRSSLQTQNETVMNRNQRSINEVNSQMIQSLYNAPFTQEYVLKNSYGSTQVQRIAAKSKPISPVTMNSENFSTHFSTLKTQSVDNGSRFQEATRKMTFNNLLEKFEPLRGVQICLSHRVSSRHELQNVKSMYESESHSSSRLVSISKSISSFHQTNKKSKPKISQIFADEKWNQDKEISVNFSQIFSSRDKNESIQQQNRRRSFGGVGMKRINLLQDMDKNTIESKVSRQCDSPSDYQIKIEESIVHDHDLKQSFNLLEDNKIISRDYILSQALEKTVGIFASFKQFISAQEMKTILHELQAHEVRGKACNEIMDCHILELYRIQVNENSCILILEPYTETLRGRLMKCSKGEQIILIQKAKQIMSTIIECFESFSFHLIRKVTINQFVCCMGVVKLHDLSVFRHMREPYFSKEEAISELE